MEATEEEKAAALAAAKVKADELVSKVSAADDRSAAFAELAPDYVAESAARPMRATPTTPCAPAPPAPACPPIPLTAAG